MAGETFVHGIIWRGCKYYSAGVELVVA
jgi:hypothetical protein